jgi:type II secretory pathway component PulF
MFSSRLSLPALIQWCRALRYGLHAGLSPVKVLRQQAKSGPLPVRPLADQLADALKDGESFADALKPHRTKFPKLFTELVAVGESAGKLPEVFEELEKYFEAQLDGRKKFLQALVWPALSYMAAVVTMSILASVLGVLAPPGGGAQSGPSLNPFGLNKFGAAAGLIVFALGFGFGAVVVFVYLITRDNDDLKQKVEAVGIKIPGLQGAYRSFALQRFSLALAMTHEAGMRADKAVFSSFQATSNNAYLKLAEPTAAVVRKGKKIAKALGAAGGALFPDEFLDQVTIGEESGQITEVMHRAAEQYREQGVRHAKMLAMIAGAVVYLMVALLVIALIISLVMSIAGVYNSFLNDPLGNGQGF